MDEVKLGSIVSLKQDFGEDFFCENNKARILYKSFERMSVNGMETCGHDIDKIIFVFNFPTK
jgi:hypothetical protein